MMRKKLFIFVVAAVFAAGGERAAGQFYDWGQNPAGVKWRTIRTPEFRYIFPDIYERNTVRIMHYMDTVRAQIDYGFTHGPLKRIPLVVHAYNFSPNGIMMLAPKRMEMIVTPGAQQFAFPHLKQLAVHEYRHAVQYGNIDRGLIRVLSVVLGQQGTLVGVGQMPIWALEGDAVLAETQMSTFGRGMQPSFSIEYRAMALEGRGDYPADKYFSGSFRDFMPNHYQLGYQILSWADDHYGENVLDKAARFNSRNPYLIFPFSVGMRKYYGMTGGKLFREAFGELFDYWRSLPAEDNSASIISTPVTSYTIYSSPVHNPGGGYVVLKTDLDRPSRLMLVDERGGERPLCRTGSVNSPLTMEGNTVWWTELRQSMFWEQLVYSQLCSYDIAADVKKTYRDRRNVLFPVAMPGGGAAGVEYDHDGTYSIVYGGWKCPLPDTVTVHGLAYEKSTAAFYFIALSDAGMWIGAASPAGGPDGDSGDDRRGAQNHSRNNDGQNRGRDDLHSPDGGWRMVTRPGFATLSHLRAGDGVLYFNSIASGKDEAHMYDLANAKEYRLTTSRYGSFSPAGSDGKLVLTTYTPDGYMLARQDIPDRLTEVPYSRIPRNAVNPPRRKWEVANMDEVTVADTTRREVRRYRKGLHLFNFHSWAPAYYEADRIMSEERFDVHAGVTLLSQNHLNSTFTQLTYGWTGGNNVIHGKFNYSGWAPKFELEALWSDSYQIVVGPQEVERPARLSDYLELTGRAYLPFLLSSGADFRTLVPSVEYQYTNAKIYDYAAAKFKTGIHKFVFGLQFVENRRMAHRDFLPRFGYAVRVNLAADPFNSEFSKLWTAFGRLFLPGVAPHHSIMLRGAYQKQNRGAYVFSQKELFPRGADFGAVATLEYTAVSADYQLPLWYPDGGINSILYFRRVRLNLFGDYARFRNAYAPDGGTGWHGVGSFGADLIFDVVPFRLPSNTSMTITISVRKPSDRNDPQLAFGISMPL